LLLAIAFAKARIRAPLALDSNRKYASTALITITHYNPRRDGH
jgi:hypothetical protein